ncbi:hypothetical protein [Glycomyces tritici]|uniref:PEGA domain-containing protein n=1 Tax=Glycomyces tritici TaxID=2665176 RepID=A0ABT7YJE1_9ACTN|nr:hypothetical protein [Glycomyces tritici]MDN3238747.1 hypothetical protein [Glycomyces tritici]
MELTAGRSPCFKAPWRAWRIAPIGRMPSAPGGGVLRLRTGYCRGLGGKPLGPRAEAYRARRSAGDPVASMDDLKAGLVPVVLVDGRAVAAGWGSIDLPLTAGRHLVEVQSLHSRTWRAVDIQAGSRTDLDYVGVLGEVHRNFAIGRLHGALAANTGHTLGPRGRLNYRQYLPALAGHRRSAVLAVVAMLLCPLILVGAVRLGLLTAGGPVPEAAGFVFVFGIPVAALAGWALRVLWTYLRYNRLPPEAPLDTRPFTPSELAAPTVLDPEGETPALSPGSAGLLIEARFVKADLSSEELARQLPSGQARINGAQRKALDWLGELVPIRHRTAVPAPELVLDGARVAASWTRMWFEVAPGLHRLELSAPEAPLPVPGGSDDAAREVAAFEVAAGQIARIELVIDLTAVPDPERSILHRWDARIDRFGPRGAQPETPAPKVDLRGGLRRMWTNRYWEAPER